jgi:protocatechuate 4,5-dioxygenase beta chain
MPLDLGLASSHAPFMFSEAKDWDAMRRRLVREVPPPRELADETPEVVDGYVGRIRAGFADLQRRLIEYKPDALIIVGDDQNEVFAPNNMPSIAIFTGEEAAGTRNIGLLGQPIEENHVHLKTHTVLAKLLADRLVERGFDLALMDEFKAMYRPAGGLGHAFTRIAGVMELERLDIPVILVFLNGYHSPMPTARRCFDLGRAIADVLADRPERVAIYGSGGLSHDPGGPRAGWIDEKLDRWVLSQIEAGCGEALTQLYTFDSDIFHGGTGEIRAWVTAAGAFDGLPGHVVDYMAAYMAVGGLGFAYWQRQPVAV